jgi:hypothetical protein
MANLVQALQRILRREGENLRSERGVLTVDTFSGKSSEDPVS